MNGMIYIDLSPICFIHSESKGIKHGENIKKQTHTAKEHHTADAQQTQNSEDTTVPKKKKKRRKVSGSQSSKGVTDFSDSSPSHISSHCYFNWENEHESFQMSSSHFQF